MITCLALGDKQSSSTVWTNFDNETGWPAGVTFLTGLITPCLIFAGIDACFHLAEEATHPRKTVPRALLTTAALGGSCAFAFAVAMCYCITDLESLLESRYVKHIICNIGWDLWHRINCFLHPASLYTRCGYKRRAARPQAQSSRSASCSHCSSPPTPRNKRHRV